MGDMNLFERMCAESVDGHIPPASFLKSPQKILMWRALAAGQRFHCHSAKAAFGWIDVKAAALAIRELRAAGVAHVVGWTRNGDRGPMAPIVAFGPGEDIPTPAKLSATFCCKRWRDRHPERRMASDRKYRLKKKIESGKMPVGNDPLLAAIMGI